MTASPLIISAGLLVPVDAPPLSGGAAAIVGSSIAQLGEPAALKRAFPTAEIVDLSHCAVLPGFVNAHTHLELSYLNAEKLAGGSFTDWVTRLMAAYPAVERVERVICAAAGAGAWQSIQSGVTTVGDISRHCALTRLALAVHPLRVVSFGEVVALGKMRGRLEPMLAAATEAPARGLAAVGNPRTMIRGVSPHAPYTVEGPALERIVKHAVARGLPIAMHLAELAEEQQFLTDLSGPLGHDWKLMDQNVLDNDVPTFAGTPVAWAAGRRLLDAAQHVPVVLAHANYVTDDDLDLLAKARASVAFCPRTHAYFGHPQHGAHRFREMLARGINVCLATDSLASNPDLHLLREAQFVHRQFPDVPAETLFEMITLRGAQALGLAQQIGSITPGKAADLVAFSLPSNVLSSPARALEFLLHDAPSPEAVFVDGTRIHHNSP